MTFNAAYLLNTPVIFVVVVVVVGLFLIKAASGEETWRNKSDVKETYFSLYSVYLLNFFSMYYSV